MKRTQMEKRRRGEMDPQIVQRSAFTMAGLMCSGKHQSNEIPELWQALGPRFQEIQHVSQPDIAYGVCGNFDEDTGTFDYLAGIEVDCAAELPEGMVSWEVPAATYAVFTCTLPTLHETHARIHCKWFPESSFRRAQGPEVERYDEHFDPKDPDSRMEIYIPVQPLRE
jgi:AraC family transcriptional regulator